MIFKVLYQPTRLGAPTRELTRSLWVEGNSVNEVLKLIENKTPYSIELIIPLEGAFLEYEQAHPDFELWEPGKA